MEHGEQRNYKVAESDMTEVTWHAHISFFRLQKPLNSNTVGTCVFVAKSQKNSMEFSRQSERQKSLCVSHTLLGMLMNWRQWWWIPGGPVRSHKLHHYLPPVILQVHCPHPRRHQVRAGGRFRTSINITPKITTEGELLRECEWHNPHEQKSEERSIFMVIWHNHILYVSSKHVHPKNTDAVPGIFYIMARLGVWGSKRRVKQVQQICIWWVNSSCRDGLARTETHGGKQIHCSCPML